MVRLSRVMDHEGVCYKARGSNSLLRYFRIFICNYSIFLNQGKRYIIMLLLLRELSGSRIDRSFSVSAGKGYFC